MFTSFNEERLIMSAVLTKSVEYNKYGRLVRIESGTPVDVDVESNICLIHNDHVQLSQDDFQLSYLN